MAQLDALLSDLANFEALQDLDGLRRVREQIAAQHPDSAQATEAIYKIGLDLLFRARDLEQAVGKFEEAAKRKTPYWSDAARTSLGLCYYHQHRAQKALLELRKVAHAEKPSAHSVAAITFIETIYESEGNKDELKKARKERLAQLEKLAKDAPEPKERGYFMYMLGMALREQGDDARANQMFDQAKALGPEGLGAELYRSVLDARR